MTSQAFIIKKIILLLFVTSASLHNCCGRLTNMVTATIRCIRLVTWIHFLELNGYNDNEMWCHHEIEKKTFFFICFRARFISIDNNINDDNDDDKDADDRIVFFVIHQQKFCFFFFFQMFSRFLENNNNKKCVFWPLDYSLIHIFVLYHYDVKS